MTNGEFYVVTYPVAVLDEHVMVNPETGEPVNVDEKLLHKIAAVNNARLQRTGDMTPITIGHTRDGADEDKQPKVIGFCHSYVVKPFFKTGRKALFSKWLIYKDKVPLLREYPRRSIEIWLDDLVIDPIAVLGATAPDRDLGPVRLSKEGARVKLSRTVGDEPMALAPEDIQQILAEFQQLPVVKFMEQLMQQVEAEGGQEGQAESEGQAADMAQGGQPGDQMPPQDQPMEEEQTPAEEPVKKAASCGVMGSNGSPPGMAEEGRAKMSKSEQLLASRLKTVEDQNKVLVIKFAKSERTKDLLKLQAEGVDLDVAEELAIIAPDSGEIMAETTYQNYLNRVKKRYQKAPVGIGMIQTADISQPQSVKAKVDKAVNLALNRGIQYEDAMKLVESGQAL